MCMKNITYSSLALELLVLLAADLTSLENVAVMVATLRAQVRSSAPLPSLAAFASFSISKCRAVAPPIIDLPYTYTINILYTSSDNFLLHSVWLNPLPNLQLDSY